MAVLFGYEEAFAHYAPIMRERWKRSTPEARRYAANDIRLTLRLHDERNAYTAKLYAELDAIRDAEHAYQQKLEVRDTKRRIAVGAAAIRNARLA